MLLRGVNAHEAGRFPASPGFWAGCGIFQRLGCSFRSAPQNRATAVRKDARKQVWRRRLIALATAYLVALSGLIASFATARAAAEATFDPLGAICHHAPAGQSAPLGGRSNGNTCIDCCCFGCLMPLAALPPAPITLASAPATVSHRIVPRAFVALGGARTAKSHRSRAPPYIA